MSQYGIDPYGEDLGPWGGPGLITLRGVLLAAQNRFIVVFDQPPLARDPKGWRDATNTRNYTIEPIDPTITINGISVIPDKAVVPTRRIALARARQDREDPRQIHVWTDRDMEPRIEHRVTIVVPIHGAGCEDFVGPTSDTFWAPDPPPVAMAPDQLSGLYRDLDDGGTPASGGDLPGVWRYIETGEIALQSELEALKKRIIRRCTNVPGAFAWSDNGVLIVLNQQMRPETLTYLANRVAEQARVDALVAAASATVTPQISGGDAYVIVTLAVQLRDRRDLTLTFKLAVK
mgnify:CR=1 FL=1